MLSAATETDLDTDQYTRSNSEVGIVFFFWFLTT